jgi:hypothetical protein
MWSRCPLLTILSHEIISPISKMSISHLVEWQSGWIFEMMRNLNHEIDWKLRKLKFLKNIEKVSNFLDFFWNFKIQKLVFVKSKAKKLKFLVLCVFLGHKYQFQTQNLKTLKFASFGKSGNVRNEVLKFWSFWSKISVL